MNGMLGKKCEILRLQNKKHLFKYKDCAIIILRTKTEEVTLWPIMVQSYKRIMERVLEFPLAHLTYSNIQQTMKASLDAHAGRLDYYAETEDNIVVHLEMERNKKLANQLEARSRYYQGLIDSRHHEQKQDFDYLKDTRQVYIIFICAFDPFGEKQRRYKFTGRCEAVPALDIQDKAIRIFLNIKGKHSDGCSPELKRFLDYVNGDKRHCQDDELLRDIEDKIQELRRNDGAKEEYMHIIIGHSDYYGAGLLDGEKRGEKRGAAKERAKADAEKKNSIINLLRNNVAPAIIATSMSMPLSQVEAIAKTMQS